ncbi:MAG TPA: hypothetical protein VLC09_15670, partial [Polyangiaceae bacterium]|nr:hypothetical protein [Polyangiaceae bacterium]
PGPWPVTFPASKGRKDPPSSLETEVVGCDAQAEDVKRGGIFYAESFLELDQSQEVVLMASGALALWVDDHLVLERDIRNWGIWPKFGVHLRLSPGRHRVLWKGTTPSTSLRVVRPDGHAIALRSDTAARSGYQLGAPQVLGEPNELMRYIKDGDVELPSDPLTIYLAAYLAAFEGQSDVATVLFEPLVKDPASATGFALLTAANFVEGDPIYDESQTRDLVHELEVRSVERDPRLWAGRLRNALWEGGQKGPVAAVEPLEKLVQEFPEVPLVHYTLARVYEELGWGPELERVAKRLVAQYPDSPDAITLGIDLADTEGNFAEVDRLLAKLLQIQPDTEVPLARALGRRDYAAAITELKRLGERRPERKDIAERIVEVMVRAGDQAKAWERLEKAVEREPRDVHARLSVADAQYARGDHAALAKALAEAIRAGADAGMIEDAIDLVEGMTALEPYRLDARQVIAEYEKRGRHQEGTAARVLDYGAVLVRSDGSSRFLEHEVVRVQSEEGIRNFTEMDAQGLLLHLRVLKKDGRVLEPEAVAGKPTATMPHLEIGDYVEVERILSNYGDGEGSVYRGPSWFFREESVAYARSEFLVVAPVDAPLVIEAVNGVPEPVVTQQGAFVARRFRMDDSPAAPAEPSSPPASEFMPRVTVSWGVDFEDRIQQLAQGLIPLGPDDPRLVRIAEKIVAGVPANRPLERAQRLYHWTLENVQEGEESDGRRVVVSRNGNRWKGFETLCSALDLPVRWAVAESRLASPTVGPTSSAERPLFPVLVVGSGSDATWLTIEDRYAPFGTVPSHLAGEPAYLLGSFEAERTRVPPSRSPDAIRYEGRGSIRADGSASLSIDIRFIGKFAASLRNGLSQIPESQLGTVIESRMLGQYLQGAQLTKYEVLDAERLDQPLTLAVQVEVPQFATPTGAGLLLSPPFMPRLSQLSTLATRVTPLLLADASEQSVALSLQLPEGFGAEVAPASGDGGRSRYRVEDASSPGQLVLSRTVQSEAGRIDPGDYPAFQRYTQQADTALSRAVRLVRKR